jgi:hypothetical protein
VCNQEKHKAAEINSLRLTATPEVNEKRYRGSKYPEKQNRVEKAQGNELLRGSSFKEEKQ